MAACGDSVEGALVYVTTVPYGQFGIPDEQTTGSVVLREGGLPVGGITSRIM